MSVPRVTLLSVLSDIVVQLFSVPKHKHRLIPTKTLKLYLKKSLPAHTYSNWHEKTPHHRCSQLLTRCLLIQCQLQTMVRTTTNLVSFWFLIIAYGTGSTEPSQPSQPNTRRSSRSRNPDAATARQNTLSDLISKPGMSRKKQVPAPTTGERGKALASQRVISRDFNCSYTVLIHSKNF